MGLQIFLGSESIAGPFPDLIQISRQTLFIFPPRNIEVGSHSISHVITLFLEHSLV